MKVEDKIISQLKDILDNDFRWIKSKNNNDYEGITGDYANAQEGADKILLLLKKYPRSLFESINQFEELYSRRLPHYDNYAISDTALYDIVALTTDIIRRLEKGLIKIKIFNFNKPLNPIEKGLLWLLGILGFPFVFEKFIVGNMSPLLGLTILLSIRGILLLLVSLSFFFLLFYFRYEP